MPLSLSVSITVHTTHLFSLSLFNIHAHAKTPAQKKKWLFQLSPVAPLYLSPALFLVEKIYILFSFWIFMQRLSYSVDTTPTPPSRCTNTADGRHRRCHDTVMRGFQQIPLNSPANRPWVGLCVSLKLSCVGVCVSVYFWNLAFEFIWVSRDFCCCFFIPLNFLPWLIYDYFNGAYPLDWDEDQLITAFKIRKELDTRLIDFES